MIFRLLLVIALLGGLHGCASLSLEGPPPSIHEIDAWLDHHQYSKVFDALNRIPRDHPDYVHYAARRTAAESRAKKYEESILAEVARAEKKQDWPGAIAVVDAALDNYPESLQLSQKRAELIGHQQRRAKILAAEALLARADWLQNELPLREQKAKHAPVDITLQWSLGQLKNEIAGTVSKLIASATDLFEYDEVDLVGQCLQQARELHPSPADIKTISLLEDRLAIRRDELERKRLAREARESSKQNARLKKQQAQRASALLEKTNAAVRDNDLVSARKHITELNKIAPDNAEVIRLDAYIKARIDSLVKQMTDEGSMLYRQEKIESAKKIWEEALRLDPNNKTLKANIRRAARVLEKLEKLRAQQTPG